MYTYIYIYRHRSRVLGSHPKSKPPVNPTPVMVASGSSENSSPRLTKSTGDAGRPAPPRPIACLSQACRVTAFFMMVLDKPGPPDGKQYGTAKHKVKLTSWTTRVDVGCSAATLVETTCIGLIPRLIFHSPGPKPKCFQISPN